MLISVFVLSLRCISKITQSIIPDLSGTNHKGSMGRVGIVGGSSAYTGAPYYSGISALKFGADLAFVLCSSSASIPIKSYSPELMVVPFYDDTNEYLEETYHSQVAKSSLILDNYLTRVNSLVIGPGLGRHDLSTKIVENLMIKASERNIPMVIDADALWIVSNNLSLIFGCTW